MTDDKLPTQIRALIGEFADLFCDLARVNRRIGIWDMRRHEECKNTLDKIDLPYLVKTERLGRIGVETRARLKTRLDEVFAELAQASAAHRRAQAQSR